MSLSIPVARPVEALQPFHGRIADRQIVAAIDVADILQKRLGQHRNIFKPLLQRRQMDGDQIQTMEQIFTKLAFFNHKSAFIAQASTGNFVLDFAAELQKTLEIVF
jgi:hypothetical protein